ncbi:MAG: tetratricopeptide repeat protein [Methanothrix sp.]|jgi:tetratricopeptide (TPR) repeat protein|nr:tetratricopeptide repeat protein [Methanothrix sp.]
MTADTPENQDNCDGKSINNVSRNLSAKGLEGAMMIVKLELEKEPDSWEAWSAKADILYLQKKYDRSLECCEKSLAINSKNSLTWNTKGNVYYMLGRYDEAIACYNRAIEIDPLLARSWYNKKLALEIQLKKVAPGISMTP